MLGFSRQLRKSIIHALPVELLSEILVYVGADSLHDLFNAIQT